MATYYLSSSGNDSNDGRSPITPWKTIKKANSSIKGGDTLCLHRGDTFYGAIVLPRQNTSGTPTVIKDYGKGAKPIVSQYKIALGGAWVEHQRGIWKIDLLDTECFEGNVTELDVNAGFLKVDGQIKYCKRFEIDKLCDLWDFYNDDRYLYVRCDSDPSSIAKEIKIACNVICMRFANDLTVENIIFMGTGAHGISGSVRGATVCGCEFHEIGGSELLTYHEPCVRYGNGVECWSDSADVLVENCRFSGIYDVAMTMQGPAIEFGWKNITFRGNVVWNCTQSFEIWSDGESANLGFQNCVFENNVCLDSGYGWGYEARPNKACSAHLLLYSLGAPLCDVTVKSNTFYRAKVSPIFKFKGPQAIPKDYRITENTFLIDHAQDIAYRYGCTDAEYDDFYKKIACENHIIQST